jgi:TPR repeat protein
MNALARSLPKRGRSFMRTITAVALAASAVGALFAGSISPAHSQSPGESARCESIIDKQRRASCFEQAGVPVIDCEQPRSANCAHHARLGTGEHFNGDGIFPDQLAGSVPALAAAPQPTGDASQHAVPAKDIAANEATTAATLKRAEDAIGRDIPQTQTQEANPSSPVPITRPSPIEAKTVDQTSVYDCDRLAASPFDPSRAADGVPSDTIDTASAISSCAQAVRDNPTNARFQFEYGRAFDAAKRYDEAMRWYREAADQGYSAAQVGLGFIYYYGHGVPQNYGEAMRWLHKAAEQGNAVAQNTLGVMYINGQGVSQNYAEGLEWYRKAADQGFATAQTNLGAMYFLGQGVSQNYSEAMKWYRKAADQGNADAQNTVGAMYESGHGVMQDYAQAANWYRKAAEQDNDVAQHNLGVLYHDGHGVPQDYAEAAEWFRRAADHGNAKAQYDLGALYYRGQGLETNHAEALKWFRKAADQGNAKDQNTVGEMYANGQGVPQNYAEAIRWFRMAADQGDPVAQKNLTALSAQPLITAPQQQTLVPRGSEKPSFDCAQAKTAAARLICADGELARLDGELGVAFQNRKIQIAASDQSKFVAAQVKWIRDRNGRCELVGKESVTIEMLASSKPCMVTLIRERIAFLAQTEVTAGLAVSATGLLSAWQVLNEDCRGAPAIIPRQ